MPKWVVKKHRTLPGVWERTDALVPSVKGGCQIRGAAVDPRTGKRKDFSKVLLTATPLEAYNELQALLTLIREGKDIDSDAGRIRFKDFVKDLIESKCARGDIRSAATKSMWASFVDAHLSTAEFYEMYVDSIRTHDYERWCKRYIEPKLKKGLSPHTANTWLRNLRVISKAFAKKLGIVDPSAGVESFNTRGRRSFTMDQPNSLKPNEIPIFLAKFKELYPKYYLIALLGFITGLRPSTLRPIRIKEDVNFEEGYLLICRSYTMGDKKDVMDFTKTDEDQRIGLPPEIMDAIKHHISELEPERATTGLLFPSLNPEKNPFMYSSALQLPFNTVSAAVADKIGGKRITPKGMRRTAVDMQRRAALDQRIRTAISGHKSEAVQRLYETVGTDETRQAVAKVINLLEWKKTAANE